VVDNASKDDPTDWLTNRYPEAQVIRSEENLGFGLYALPIINPDGSKNRARSIPYHRLDLSLRYQLSTPRFQHRFKVGVYNAYNQANEAFQRLNYNPDLGMEELNSISFLPVLPSLSYSLQF